MTLDLVPPADDQGDTSLTINGRVTGVDVPNRLVQVAFPGSVVWLPAMPSRYRLYENLQADGASAARVLRDPAAGRPVLVLGALNPMDPDQPATMTAINTTTKRATVTYRGVAYDLPYLAASYAAPPSVVWVGLSDWGIPVIVRGPSDTAASGAAPGGTTPPPSSVAASAVIGPQWSSSWRASRSRWTDSGDVWNTGRYGGGSTLYQGNGFGSGPMTGLATYGDQIVNLGASSIQNIRVLARSVGLSGASGPASFQGSASGSNPGGAPSSSGDVITGSDEVYFTPTMNEEFRTGAKKGLAMVGANYWAVAGAGTGDGMVLLVDYTRPS